MLSLIMQQCDHVLRSFFFLLSLHKLFLMGKIIDKC